MDFQTKVESKKHPDHAGISTNDQLAKQAERSHDERKELSTEEERVKSLTRASKDEGRECFSVCPGYYKYVKGKVRRGAYAARIGRRAEGRGWKKIMPIIASNREREIISDSVGDQSTGRV